MTGGEPLVKVMAFGGQSRAQMPHFLHLFLSIAGREARMPPIKAISPLPGAVPMVSGLLKSLTTTEDTSSPWILISLRLVGPSPRSIAFFTVGTDAGSKPIMEAATRSSDVQLLLAMTS